MNIEEIMKTNRLFEVYTFNLDLLKYRISKLTEIDTSDKNNKFEFFTYFDAAIVQIRAMFLEKRSKNFTFQSFLRVINRPNLVEKVEEFFDEPFDGMDFQSRDEGLEYRSIRKVIKFITDKFVCHNDETTSIDQGNQDYFVATLANPHNQRYLSKLLEDLFAIFEDVEAEIEEKS